MEADQLYTERAPDARAGSGALARVGGRTATRLVPAWAWLALLGAVACLPFVRATPINWDGVQFSLALERFDLHNHQPHPPGYILYVFLGRALNLVVGDPTLTLSLLSVLCVALALPLARRLGLSIFEDEVVAWGAALIVAASPLTLYYGSVGLTYLPEMLISALVGLICWHARYAPPGHALFWSGALGLALGLAGGVRQTSMVVLLPLCVWAIWGRPLRAYLLAVGLFACACLVWVAPLLALSGGVAAYLRESSLLAEAVMGRTSVLEAGVGGLLHNLTFEGLGLVLALGLGLIPLCLWALRLISFSLSRQARFFFLLWTLPPLLLYSVSHVGQYGYLLVVLPPLALLSAVCVRVAGLLLRGARLALRASIAAYALIVLFSVGYFAWAQGPTTYHNIVQNDRRWQALRASLKTYDPSSTVLLTSIAWDGPFRQAGYLLPEYRTYGVDVNEQGILRWLYSAQDGRSDYALPMPRGGDKLPLPAGTTRLLVLDGLTAARLAPEGDLECALLADGSTLYALSFEGSAVSALEIECSQIGPATSGLSRAGRSPDSPPTR